MTIDRYYVVDDPVTRALGGTSTRWGIVDREALPLKGEWCNAGVYTSKATAQGMTDLLNANDRLMKLDAALYPPLTIVVENKPYIPPLEIIMGI